MHSSNNIESRNPSSTSSSGSHSSGLIRLTKLVSVVVGTILSLGFIWLFYSWPANWWKEFWANRNITLSPSTQVPQVSLPPIQPPVTPALPISQVPPSPPEPPLVVSPPPLASPPPIFSPSMSHPPVLQSSASFGDVQDWFKQALEYVRTAQSPSLTIAPDTACNGFPLLHTDFLALDLGKIANKLLALQTLIYHLQNYLNQCSSEQKPYVEMLLRNLICAAFVERYLSWTRVNVTQEIDFCQARDFLLEQFKQHLKKGSALYLLAGWNAQPAGHAIVLELTLQDPQSVLGRVVNRGAGLNAYHQGFAAGTKIKYNPEIILQKTSLDKIFSNRFFH